MTPPNIPFWYRLWHLYLEPIGALGGVYHLHAVPLEYFKYMPPTAKYSPGSQIVCDQLAATYLLFSWIELVLLRVVDDVRTWKYILFGLALCDLGHILAAWQEAGTEWILSPWVWDARDITTNILNVLPFITRMAFILEVGYKSQDLQKKKS